EIAGSARSAPARIFAFGCDQLDLNGDATVGECGNADVEAVADLDGLDQVLTQIEVYPQVAEIDQRHQRYSGRDIFAGFYVALIDLRGNRRIDHHLVDDRLYRLDVGNGFADIGLGDLVLFFGITIDRLIVGRLGLIDGTLILMQRIGGLV